MDHTPRTLSTHFLIAIYLVIYFVRPDGYFYGYVCVLLKNLYCLKQVLYLLKQHLYEWFLSINFTPLDAEEREFHKRRELPYKRTYLLNGPAGTGKSSMGLGLAGELNRPLRVIRLSDPSSSDEFLRDLTRNRNNESVFMLTDLDYALERTRQAYEENKQQLGITKWGLMDLLDLSTVGCDGKIFLVTVNDKDRVDTFVLRDGRVDREINFDYLSADLARGIFLNVFGLDDGELLRSLQAQAKYFEVHFPEKVTPAKLMRYLMEMRDGGPEMTLSNMNRLVADLGFRPSGMPFQSADFCISLGYDRRST